MRSKGAAMSRVDSDMRLFGTRAPGKRPAAAVRIAIRLWIVAALTAVALPGQDVILTPGDTPPLARGVAAYQKAENAWVSAAKPLESLIELGKAEGKRAALDRIQDIAAKRALADDALLNVRRQQQAESRRWLEGIGAGPKRLDRKVLDIGVRAMAGFFEADVKRLDQDIAQLEQTAGGGEAARSLREERVAAERNRAAIRDLVNNPLPSGDVEDRSFREYVEIVGRIDSTLADQISLQEKSRSEWQDYYNSWEERIDDLVHTTPDPGLALEGKWIQAGPAYCGSESVEDLSMVMSNHGSATRATVSGQVGKKGKRPAALALAFEMGPDKWSGPNSFPAEAGDGYQAGITIRQHDVLDLGFWKPKRNCVVPMKRQP